MKYFTKELLIIVLFYVAGLLLASIGLLILEITQLFQKYETGYKVFFFALGILQLFWAIPMIRHWGLKSYYIGMGITLIIIIALYVARYTSTTIDYLISEPVDQIIIVKGVLEASYLIITGLLIIFKKTSYTKI